MKDSDLDLKGAINSFRMMHLRAHQLFDLQLLLTSGMKKVRYLPPPPPRQTL